MPTAKKLPSGTWRVRIYVGRNEGKDLYKSFTGSSKREAERRASSYLAIKHHSELTFGDAADRYIDAKENVLSSNTIRTYRTIRRRLTALESVRMSRLDSEMVQRVIDRLSADLSPKTVRSTYGFITVVTGMFEPDKTLSITLPEPEHKETLIPTREEVRRMIEEAPSEDLRIAIQLAAFCSLRSGEACALQTDMIKRDHIRISRTLVLTDSGEWITKNSPKTLAGYRDIPVPAALMAQIRAQKREDGRIIKYTPASLHDAFRRLTRRLKFPPYKFHSLRHYFATSCHNDGIPDKVIAKLGGWEDVGTLHRIYQHATPDKLEEAGEILQKLFSKTMTQTMTRDQNDAS